MKYFKTNNVILRKFEMDDVVEAYNNLLVYNGTTNVSNLITHENLEETKVIIKSAMNEFYTEEPIWAIEDKKTKHLIGYIRVINYSPKNKMCNLTWAMSCEYWNEDNITEAINKILKFLFSKKDIELVESSYYGEHELTKTVLEKVGMVREATLRNRYYNEITNEKEDFVIYSINKSEFLSKN